MTPTLIALPLIGALIGWFTNYLAVKMLFRPRTPTRILGLTFIGVIPRRRSDLAHKIAETVESELISSEDIRGALQDPEYQDKFVAVLEDRFTEFVTEKMASMSPLITAFISADMVAKLKEALVGEVQRRMPAMVDTMIDHLERKLDLKQIVVDRIEAFEIEKLEALVLGIARKELKHIELLGGVLGFAIGLVQTAVVYFTL